MSDYEIGKDVAALIQRLEVLERGNQKLGTIGRRQIEMSESGIILPGYCGEPVGLNADGSHIWECAAANVISLPSSTEATCDRPLQWLQSTSTLRGGLCHLHIEAPVSDGVGSGSLISKRCVLTAAHCLYDDGRYVASVNVSPGRQGMGGTNIRDPFGTHRAGLVRVPEEWRLHRNEEFDFGIAVLDNEDCFNRTNFYLGVEVHRWSSDPAFHWGNVQGYPASGAGIVVGNPYFSYGQFMVGSGLLTHRMSTHGGMSGGPYVMSTGPDMKVMGIHSGGNCPNRGVRITESKIRMIHEWIDLYG